VAKGNGENPDGSCVSAPAIPQPLHIRIYINLRYIHG
jgi:hypothetical protein